MTKEQVAEMRRKALALLETEEGKTLTGLTISEWEKAMNGKFFSLNEMFEDNVKELESLLSRDECLLVAGMLDAFSGFYAAFVLEMRNKDFTKLGEDPIAATVRDGAINTLVRFARTTLTGDRAAVKKLQHLCATRIEFKRDIKTAFKPVGDS